MVPMAPSSTKMRSFIFSMKALRALVWDALTITPDPPALCADLSMGEGSGFGPQAQQMADA